MTFPIFSLMLIVAYATATDLREHRIPNWLCLCGLLLGLGFQVTGGAAYWSIAASVLVPFAIFLPFYAMGGMAAGDVKLMAACGALVGWPSALIACGLTLAIGAILGIGVYVARGGWSSLWARYGMPVRAFFNTGQLFLEPPPEESIAASRFPYALAIALGSLGSVLMFRFI